MFEKQGENEKWTKSYESCDVTPTPLKGKPLILLPNRESGNPLRCRASSRASPVLLHTMPDK